MARTATLLERRAQLSAIDAIAATDIHFTVERRKVHSVEPFATLSEEAHQDAVAYLDGLARLVALPQIANVAAVNRNQTVYERNTNIQGPMSAFGYSYLEDNLPEDEYADLKLRSYTGIWGSSGQYVYEALNFVDGSRTVSDIRDWLTTELGPVPLDYVEEYLAALESIDVIRKN
jgi:hypothetical protein